MTWTPGVCSRLGSVARSGAELLEFGFEIDVGLDGERLHGGGEVKRRALQELGENARSPLTIALIGYPRIFLTNGVGIQGVLRSRAA